MTRLHDEARWVVLETSTTHLASSCNLIILLCAQGNNWVQAGGTAGGIETKNDPYRCRETKGQQDR